MSFLTPLSNKYVPNIEMSNLGFDQFGVREPIPTQIDEQMTNTAQTVPELGINGGKIESLSVAKLSAGSLNIDTFVQSTGYSAGVSGWRIDGQGNAEFNTLTLTGSVIKFGKTSFSDSANAGYYISSSGIYFGTASDTTYVKYDIGAATLTIVGAIAATSGTIGGFNIGSDYVRDAANSFGLASTVTAGDDVRFWAGAAFESRSTAPFRITESGALTATSATITGALTTSSGSSLNGTYLLSNTVTSAKVNLAARGWTQTSAFSVTDSDTVAWGSGTFTASDGTAYSISSGNTGNMAAKTYVYLDIGTSTTAYQTSTTASDAVGDGKVLIAVAQNNTTEATFQVFGGNGGLNIDAASIVAGSITANEIAASTITAGKLSVTQLSAITANMGAITAGTLTIDTSGYVCGGQTDYNTGTGFFLGYSGAAYKLSIGDTTTNNSLTWDGTTLSLNGSQILNNDIYGNGEDGDVTISSNTSLSKDMFYNNLTVNSGFRLTTNGYRVFVKNTLVIQGSAFLSWNGVDGTAGTNASTNSAVGGGSGGAALSSGSLYGSGAGKAGGASGAGGTAGGGGSNGSNGTAGDAITNSFASSFSSTSGAGGAGGGTSGATGGSAGTTGTISASTTRPFNSIFAVRMFDDVAGSSPALLKYNSNVGGAGGGGGGRASAGSGVAGAGGGGGGSGSGGGVMVVCARIISNSGSIESKGGNGGNGGNGANGGSTSGGVNNAGGGGGGGGTGGPGGVLVLIYSGISGGGATSVAGGSAGTGGTKGAQGTGGTSAIAAVDGTAGSTGVSGKIITLIV